jgi:hypothetical protein
MRKILKLSAILSASILFVGTPALAYDRLFLCEGKYQNRPCSGGRGVEVTTLPRLGQYSSADVAGRASFRAGSDVWSDATALPPRPVTNGGAIETEAMRLNNASLEELAAVAAKLRNNIDEVTQSKGANAARAQLHRLWVRVDALCAGNNRPAKTQTCARAKNDLQEAKQATAQG